MYNLVNKKVKISATIKAIIPAKKDRNNVERILIKNIEVNDEYIIDHSWIKFTKSFLNRDVEIKVGNNFTATAFVYEYMDSSDINKKKYGLKTFRSVKKA